MLGVTRAGALERAALAAHRAARARAARGAHRLAGGPALRAGPGRGRDGGARARSATRRKAYFDLGERIGLTWIKEQIESLPADGHWQAVARGTLRDNLYALQARITLAVLKCKGREASARVGQWLSRHSAAVDSLKRVVVDLRTVRRRISRRCQWHCKRSDALPSIDSRMPQAGAFGADYLQQRIDREIALAKPMGIIVESADGGGVVLRAPLAPNANHKGTAFGGSSVCARGACRLGVGDAAISRHVQLDADAVIQESNMRFLAPVHGELRACVEIPAADAGRKISPHAGSVPAADESSCAWICTTARSSPRFLTACSRRRRAARRFTCPEN